MSGNVDHGTTFRFETDAYLHILVQGIQKTDEPVHGEAVEASVQEFGDFGLGDPEQSSPPAFEFRLRFLMSTEIRWIRSAFA